METVQTSNKRYRLIREVIETIVLTVLIFLAINLTVQNYDVDGPSMEPSLHNQERIMVEKASYWFHAPERGDIVVFVAPPQPTFNYVKRIIGVPGDVITIHNTEVTVDGVTLQETYVDPARQGNPFASKKIENFVVPPDNFFVLGDNRMDSSDSRDWGLLPRDKIIGRAMFVYWPFGQDNNGFTPNVSSVFANVHQKKKVDLPQQNGMLDAGGWLLGILPGLSLVYIMGRGDRKYHRKQFDRSMKRLNLDAARKSGGSRI